MFGKCSIYSDRDIQEQIIEPQMLSCYFCSDTYTLLGGTCHVNYIRWCSHIQMEYLFALIGEYTTNSTDFLSLQRISKPHKAQHPYQHSPSFAGTLQRSLHFKPLNTPALAGYCFMEKWWDLWIPHKAFENLWILRYASMLPVRDTQHLICEI